eukprot:6044070-Amphidinium_carterae.1
MQGCVHPVLRGECHEQTVPSAARAFVILCQADKDLYRGSAGVNAWACSLELLQFCMQTKSSSECERSVQCGRACLSLCWDTVVGVVAAVLEYATRFRCDKAERTPVHGELPPIVLPHALFVVSAVAETLHVSMAGVLRHSDVEVCARKLDDCDAEGWDSSDYVGMPAPKSPKLVVAACLDLKAGSERCEL